MKNQEKINLSSASKKDKKREKDSIKKIQHQHYIDKLHHQIYQIPPSSQQHLRALLLQYMASPYFQCFTHQQALFEIIKNFYKNTKNVDIYMKDLDIKSIIQDLNKMKALEAKQHALGTRLVLVIQSIDYHKILQLAKQYQGDKPIHPPPDPATFQSSKSTASMINRQEREKVQKLLRIPSLFDKSRNKQLQALNQMKSFAEFAFIQEYKKKFQTQNVEYCDNCTRQKCIRVRGTICNKRHFRKILKPNTEESSGNCPHLNACLNPQCKHVHYVEEEQIPFGFNNQDKIIQPQRNQISQTQWINCDLRFFDFRVLGKFNVVMADPPWDIHMLLPYGTLKDKQMLNLRVDLLHDQGVIFLWVTGRAMQLGRQCLNKWGYKRVEQLVWVKTNQLQRLIITGRTGHWLNHTKQHCLVAIKGNPQINKNIDCDVLVSRVRQTSRKPDQIYGLIERMCPGGKKIQLFGRPHNCKPGWITLGNQLPGAYIKDKQILARYRQAYPQQDLSDDQMLLNLQKMQNSQQLNAIYNNHINKNGLSHQA